MDSRVNAQFASPRSLAGNAQKDGASLAPAQIVLAQLPRIRTEERSIPVRAALLALRFYKANLSILFAGSCRFEPTCSLYAYEAIEKFGLARGVWLGLKRLLRCHPLSRKFGYDPVPEKWEEMPTRSACGKALKTEAHS